MKKVNNELETHGSVSVRQPENLLTPGQILQIAHRMLYNINSSIAIHNEQTAFLALELVKDHQMNERCNIQNLVVLALFHTIGFFNNNYFYQSNQQDNLETDIDYFSTDKSIESKYMFSFYYLEFMTPLHKDALALESFNQNYIGALKNYLYQTEYKSIISFSARVADYLTKHPDDDLPNDIDKIAPGKFDPTYVKIFKQVNKNNRVVEQLRDGSYKESLFDFINDITMPNEAKNEIFKLLVYILDFKSTTTLSHSINTSCYALSLGTRMHLSEQEIKVLFTSALLHDVGKIATPQHILEYPGRLTPENMGIMRHHVNHSKRILQDFVPQEILEAVYRHHEKLDGSGYPNKISGDELSVVQRIITVADITSALNDSRSYKKEFTKEETIAELKTLVSKGKLDPKITNILIEDFDEIKKELLGYRNFLKVDFSTVLHKFSDYLINDAEKIIDSAVTDLPAHDEDIGVLEEV